MKLGGGSFIVISIANLKGFTRFFMEIIFTFVACLKNVLTFNARKG